MPQFENNYILLSALLPPIIYLGFYIFAAFRNRLKNDTAFSRRRTAESRFKAGLQKIEKAINTEPDNVFFNLLSETAAAYLGDMLNLPQGELTIADINKLRAENKLGADATSMITDILNKCDEVRFAGGARSAGEKLEMLEKLKKLRALINS